MILIIIISQLRVKYFFYRICYLVFLKFNILIFLTLQCQNYQFIIQLASRFVLSFYLKNKTLVKIKFSKNKE